MLSWISENIATIIVCAVLITIVALIIVRLIRNKKQGKTSCGCGCANCPSAGICHQSKKTDQK